MTADGKKIYDDFGEMLFTHFGISATVFSASSYIGRYQGKELKFIIDLKPALNKEQLDHRVLKDFNKTLNKRFCKFLRSSFAEEADSCYDRVIRNSRA